MRQTSQSMRPAVTWVLAAACALMLTPQRASADWLLTPYLGGVFGGDADFGDFDEAEDEAQRRMTFGGSIGWMGAGVIGAELDLGYTPNFFKDTRGPGATFDDDVESSVMTVMGNVILGVPVGGQRGPGVRPYAVAGVGLLRRDITGSSLFNDFTANDFGMNVGAGVVGFFNDVVGVRGDLRYFRALQDTEPEGGVDLEFGDFDFWRGTLGVTLRW